MAPKYMALEQCVAVQPSECKAAVLHGVHWTSIVQDYAGYLIGGNNRIAFRIVEAVIGAFWAFSESLVGQ